MALNVGTIEAIIRLRDELTPTLKRVGDQLASVGEDVRRAGTQIREVGSSMTLGLTVPLTAAAAAALKFSADFETVMTKVGSLTNIGIGGIGDMREEILKLAPTVGQGPQALAEGLLVVASTGLKGADAVAVLTAAARASAVGLGETKDIARAVTSAVTAYGKENLSAAEATDKLFVAVREGGAEADEFAETLGRVVGIASQVGVSFDETLAAIATFTRLGVDADEAVTGLRGTLGTILSPSKDAREQLESLGTSIGELRAQVRERGLTAALVDLVKLTKGNDDAISAIVPNVRALAAVLGTAGAQATSYKESLERIQHSTGELDKAFENVSETLGFKWNVVMAEAKTLLIQFGDAIAPAFESALPTIRSLVKVVAEAVQWFSNLPGPVKTATIAMLALGAALGPILFIVGNLTTAVGGLLTVLGGGASVAARFAAQLGLIAPAAAATTATVGTASAAMATFNTSGLNVATTTKDLIKGMSAAGLAANANFVASQQMLAGMNAVGIAARTQATAQTAAAAATANLTLAQRAGTAVMAIFAPGMVALNAAAATATTTMTGLAAAIYAQSGAARASAAIQAAFSGAMVALQAAASGAAARLGLTAAAAAAAGAASSGATVAVAALGTAMSLLGVAAAVVGTAMLAWNFGKWIGEATGLTDAIGRLTARLGEWVGLLPAGTAAQYNSMRAAQQSAGAYDEAAMKIKLAKEQYESLKASLSGALATKNIGDLHRVMTDLNTAGDLNVATMRRIGEAAKQAAEAGGKLTPELQAVVTWLNRTVAAEAADADAKMKKQQALEAAKEATEEYRKKVKALRDQLSGADALREARMYENIIKEIGGATKLTTEEAKKASEIFKEVIEKYEGMGAAGRQVVEHFRALERSLPKRSMLEFIGTIDKGVWKPFTIGAKEANDAIQDIVLGLDSFRAKGTTTMTLVGEVFKGEFRAIQINADDTRAAFEKMVVDLIAFERSTFSFGKSIKANIGDVLKSIPKTIVDGIINGASALDTVKAIVSQVGAAVGEAIGTAIGGSVGGKIGAALGSMAGLVVDAFTDSGGERTVRGVGRIWGVAITEELGNAINETSKKLFQGGRDAAMTFHFKDILGQAGGLDAANIDSFTERLRDVFVHVSTGAFNAAQATKVLNENFGAFAEFFQGGLISGGLREIVKLTKEFGIESKAVTAFLREMAGVATTGFEAIVKSELGASLEIAKQVKAAREELLKLDDDDTGFEAAKEKLDELTAKAREFNVTQQELDRLGRLAMASFGASLAAGVPFLDALNQIDETLTSMNEAAQLFGLSQMSAFGDLTALDEFFDKNEALAGSIQGVEQMLRGLHNSNLLTQESFNDLAAIAVENFDAMLASGLTFDQAMMANQDTLQRLWEIVDEGTFAVDDNTKALLEQAETAGRVGDAHRDAQDRATRAMEEAAKSMTRVGDTLLRVFGMAGDEGERFAARITTAIGKIPKEVSFAVRGQFDGSGMPTSFAERFSGGDGELPGFAGGSHGRYIDFGSGTDVTLHGRERIMTEGEGKGAGGGQIVVPVYLNGREIARAVAEDLPDALATMGVRLT